MPRVKKNDDILQLELRITPPDGQPITDWKITEDHLKFVAFVEGGPDTDKALHYHCYLEYVRSRTFLLKWIYTIAHCYNGERGNAVFFSRKPHKHTYGYISKSCNVAYRHNIPETAINEWFSQSEDYLRNKESARKRKSRTREELVSQIRSSVDKSLKDGSLERSTYWISDRLLSEFHNAKLSLPARGSFETLVMSILYPYDRDTVRSFYTKNLCNF